MVGRACEGGHGDGEAVRRMERGRTESGGDGGGAEHMAYEEVVEQEEVTVGRERAYGDGSHWY